MKKQPTNSRLGHCVLFTSILLLGACGSSSSDEDDSSAGNASSSMGVSSSSVQNSSSLQASSSSIPASSSTSLSSKNSSASVASSSTISSISSSAGSSASSSNQNAILAAPQNLSAVPGNTSVTLSWNTVTNASGYHIFYATEAGIDPDSIGASDGGTWVQNVTPPYVINTLANGTNYFFIVIAINGSVESQKSNEVSATPSAIDLTRQPTAQEVLMLELINRARFDPNAEATRYSIGLNDGITDSSISSARKPPLAHNLLLIDAARVHSQWMLDTDVFSHTGASGNSVTDRITAAGYVLSGSWAAGENIAWRGGSGSGINLTQSILAHHEGLFKSAGHRLNILSTSYREVGVGQKDGYFNSNNTNWRASMVTQAFARSGSRYFLTGVVYNDTNGDDFYTVGEGLPGITITVNGQSHNAYASGAYAIPLTNGQYDLSIAGAALEAPVNYSIQINGANVKLDAIKSGASVDVVTW